MRVQSRWVVDILWNRRSAVVTEAGADSEAEADSEADSEVLIGNVVMGEGGVGYGMEERGGGGGGSEERWNRDDGQSEWAASTEWE